MNGLLMENGSDLHMEPEETVSCATLDAIPFAMVVVNPNLDISDSNFQAREMFRCGTNGAPMNMANCFTTQTDLLCLRDALNDARVRDQGLARCRLRLWNGTFIPARLTFRSLGDSHTKYVVTIEKDAPNEAEVSEEVLRLQRLSTLGKIACGISHDLANLTMVVGFRIAKIEHAILSKGDAVKLIRETSRAAETAQELARRLVYLGRTHRSTTRAVDVNTAVRNAMSLLSGVLGAHIRTSVSCPEEPAMVWCDPVQLEQILLNLVLNAREAIPTGGCISARIRLQQVTDGLCAGQPADTEPEFVSLEIEDDGCGMTSEVQAHIFEPFFTTKDNGSGMGLSVVKRAVHEMSGDLRIRSHPGLGTTVEIQLPRHIER